jgi:hypothetical protein
MADNDGHGRAIEEVEVVSRFHAAAAGSDTDTDDEDARYYLQSSHDGDQWADASAGYARGISPASSLGSDGTLSDVNPAGSADAVARAGDAPLFACRVCGREFRSQKAENGHMKVHSQAAKHVPAAGASGGQASAVEEVGDSVSTPVAAVAAMPVLFDDTITPVQSAGSNNPVVNGGSGSSSARSSVEPSPAVANVVAAAPAAAPEQAPVAPPPAPLQQLSAAPQQAIVVAPLSAAPQQVFDGALHLAVRSDPSTMQLAPADNGQRGFSCRECGRWFPTHQGLGGHVAGHKNRRIAAEAAAAAAAGIDPLDHIACRGGAKAVKSHKCKQCGAEYASGVSLGGHMRKHYIGKPIVPRKRLRPCLPELPELALALSLQQPEPPAMGVPIVALPLASAEPAAPAAAAQPAQEAPAVPAGGVRIFGVTFEPQAKEEEEAPPVDESMNEQ